MKKLLVLTACALFILGMVAGCGQKSETEGTQEVSAGGHAEEMADTTRMDSTAMDSMAEEGSMGGEEGSMGGEETTEEAAEGSEGGN